MTTTQQHLNRLTTTARELNLATDDALVVEAVGRQERAVVMAQNTADRVEAPRSPNIATADLLAFMGV